MILSNRRVPGGVEIVAAPEADTAPPTLAPAQVQAPRASAGESMLRALEYRLPGGLSWDELETVLAAAIATGRAVGLELTIFNPALDTDGVIIRTLVARLGRALGNA